MRRPSRIYRSMLLDDGAPHWGNSRSRAAQTSVQRRYRRPIRSDDAPRQPMVVIDPCGERQSIGPAWGVVVQQRRQQGHGRAARFTEIQRPSPGIALQRHSRHVHREIEANHRNAVPHISPFCGHRDARSQAPARPVNLAGEGASVRRYQKAGETPWDG